MINSKEIIVKMLETIKVQVSCTAKVDESKIKEVLKETEFDVNNTELLSRVRVAVEDYVSSILKQVPDETNDLLLAKKYYLKQSLDNVIDDYNKNEFFASKSYVLRLYDRLVANNWIAVTKIDGDISVIIKSDVIKSDDSDKLNKIDTALKIIIKAVTEHARTRTMNIVNKEDCRRLVESTYDDFINNTVIL